MLQNLATKIRSAFSGCHKPMVRWSAERLAEVKWHLEAKDPRTWSREDHYLAVEFVIQRYLPADERRTQGQYDEKMKELKAQIDYNIDHPDAPKEEPDEDPEFAEWLKVNLK